MPFGLRFKRTRRYEVSSKNAFVVGVHMLDNSFLECTLSSDSTGQECLDSISQRIELTETQYFGLRYVTKKLQFHWVDLEKPLKKQIDKYAQASPSPRLYFGVVFYIPGAHRISDDIARYQYLLQLKTDIVDGRIPITVEQVVRLAAFCLQAEFADHEYDKNAQEYFKDNALFPKTMCKDENVVAEMINETLNGYISLQGIHPLKAEMQYIKEIQMMDGYGMEYYTAKDDKGKELYLGTSYLGIFARYLDKQPAVLFKWSEIARLTQSKKMLEVDTSKSSCQYQMEDTETAKYLRRMGMLQQKFYKANKSSPSSSVVDLSEYLDTESIVSPDLQQMSQTDFSNQLTQSQTSLTYSQHSQQSQDTRFEHEFSQSSASADDYYRQSQQSLETTGSYEYQQQQSQQMYPDGGVILNGRMYSPLMQHHQLQAPHTPPQTHVDPQVDPNYASRAAALPAYRPSPSYEEVMRRRINQQHQIQGTTPQTIANSQIYGQPGENMAYSHPEMSQYAPENDYVNSSTIRNYNNNTMYANVFQEEKNNYLQYRTSERTSNLIMQPTYSSPELTSQCAPQHAQFNSDNMLGDTLPFQYKPPPPYPRASSSTPDLAAQTNRTNNVSDSPDLVSRKSLGMSGLGLQSNLDGSVENVNTEGQDHGEEVPVSVEVGGVAVTAAPHISISNAEQSENIGHLDHDDASSDHSGATFHAKDTDSEVEDGDRTLKRDGSKTQSQIQIKYVAPSKAPPPSTSKEVVTRRESFRRMMIARTGQLNPSALAGGEDSGAVGGASNTSGAKSENEIIPEQADTEIDPAKVLDQSKVEKRSSFQMKLERRASSQSKLEKKNSLQSKLEKQSSIHSHSSSTSGDKQEGVTMGDLGEGEQSEGFPGLNYVPPVGNYMREETVKKIKELSAHQDYEDDDDERFDDSDGEADSSLKRKVGPLKMAALNGLTLSRPMVLALMNDESRAPKDERRKLLETKISENRVVKEFEEIPKKAQSMECQIAKLQENEPRNRFRDVMPYDATRVKITPRKDNSAGYINASHVKLSNGERVWWYIATQAPMSNTAVDFWQMVWEQEIDVIAMLTAVVELGKKKCFQYWPQEIGSQHKITFGQFEVTLMFCNDSLCYVTNRISVVHLPSKKERQVWHLQYTDWPDHGCPDDMYGFLGFLDEVESVQRLAESEEGSGKKSPILVHCSAGVGRTGVVILTQVMKWCLEHNHDIDLQKALGGIRQQRMYMVQTLGQYNFIHKTLIQYLKNTRLI